MSIEQMSSGEVLRGGLFLLAAVTIILMPSPGQAVSLVNLIDIFVTAVVPVMAPIIFMLLLMDIVIRSATASGRNRKEHLLVTAIEASVGLLVLLRWLPFVLAPPA